MNPVVISTWRHGLPANEAAWRILSAGGSALDAAEMGVRVAESDPHVTSVGLGGRPNSDGVVQLDACIMDARTGRAGAVLALEGIENPISVARLVMEKTPHVILAGRGALVFALAQGFTQTELLTEDSLNAWKAWREQKQEPLSGASELNHDTIGLCALDANGYLATACTTSGLAWKMPGRIGDSGIVGAGCYCESGIGAACSTGVGEEILQTGGSFLAVELMRQGYSPDEACREACRRIRRRIEREAAWRSQPIHPRQAMFIAIRADGETGAWAVADNCEHAIQTSGEPVLKPTRHEP